MAAKDTLRLKIVAAPIGPDGSYRAWPDKKTYVRRFSSEGKRNDYWRRFVEPKSSEERGLVYQIAMVNEWVGGWEFVAEPRYADEPIIGKPSSDPTVHIVECGRGAASRKAS